MWAVTIYAFRRGGWEEKLAASGAVANSYLTVLLLRPAEISYRGVEYAVLDIDLIFFSLLIFIAIRSRKFWPMWIAAITAMTVMAHLLPLMPGSSRLLYANATALWSYPMWIMLAVAVYHHSDRRLSRH